MCVCCLQQYLIKSESKSTFKYATRAAIAGHARPKPLAVSLSFPTSLSLTRTVNCGRHKKAQGIGH